MELGYIWLVYGIFKWNLPIIIIIIGNFQMDEEKHWNFCMIIQCFLWDDWWSGRSKWIYKYSSIQPQVTCMCIDNSNTIPCTSSSFFLFCAKWGSCTWTNGLGRHFKLVLIGIFKHLLINHFMKFWYHFYRKYNKKVNYFFLSHIKFIKVQLFTKKNTLSLQNPKNGGLFHR